MTEQNVPDLPVDYDSLHWKEKRAVRERYIQIQEGMCWYCHEPLDSAPAKSVREKWVRRALFPVNFFKWPVHLHHCHETGLTIGAVHSRCNAVLWQYHGE